MSSLNLKDYRMLVYKLPLTDIITTNAYFYIDEKSLHGFLIDPGAQADKVIKIIQNNHWIIEKILLTHGHFDHIGAVQYLSSELRIPYFIHQNGLQYLTNPELNLSTLFSSPISLFEASYLNDNDVVPLNAAHSFSLRVIHCPGHTQDSVIYYDIQNSVAFSGDVIFQEGYGRTDLPGGNQQLLLQNIKYKILTLPSHTILYPGHGLSTTVEEQKKLYRF